MIETPNAQPSADRLSAPGRNPVSLKDCISLGTACRMARVSEETVRRWSRKGLFLCFKVGGRLWVHRDDFYAYMESCRVMSGVSLKDFEQRRQRQRATVPAQARKTWGLDK